MVSNTKKKLFKIKRGDFFAPFFLPKSWYFNNMIPTWAIVLDYVLGTIMWTLIGRAFMNIFQREDSTFFFMRVFVKYTNPIINLFKFITPSFLFGPFIALYVAWFFYLFRFYAMPYILGYDVWGMLAFPLESDFSRQLYQLFNWTFNFFDKVLV